MIVPDEHIIDPWSTPLAFAYEAVANGASHPDGPPRGELSMSVTRSRRWRRHGRPRSQARFVVNAAGLHGDELHRAFGLDGFTIRPRRGELIVFDKLARPLLQRTVLPCPPRTPRACSWPRRCSAT